MGDDEIVRRLWSSIIISFFDGDDIYSQIDLFGVNRNKNTLRWTVMHPGVCSLTTARSQGNVVRIFTALRLTNVRNIGIR